MRTKSKQSIFSTSILRGVIVRLILTAGWLVVLLASDAALGQNYLNATGSPTFTVSERVENGFINLANGNLHFEIPVTSSPQRGRNSYASSMAYDSRIWQVFNNGTSLSWQPINVVNSQGGWRFITTVDPGSVSESLTSTICGGTQVLQTWQNFVWTESNGTQHVFPIQTSQNQCTGINVASGDAYSEDSTGYHMYVTAYTTATIFAKNGTQVVPSVKDTNGNFFSVDANGNVIDTLGRTPVTKSVVGNTTNYDVLNSQGTTSRYTVTTTTINVNTNFQQSGVTEFSGTLTVVQTIGLPDGSSYSFSYDSGTTAGHYGLLTSITLPTGGTISYTHTNFQDSFGNINQWVSSRAFGGGTWAFAPVTISTCAPGTVGCQQQVTRTQPSGDAAVYVFTLNNGAWNAQTQYFTGSAGTGTLLQTIATDFDFTNSCPLSCIGNSYIRPTRTTITDPIPGSSISRKTEYSYDSIYYGNLSAKKEWLYYTGTPNASPDRETDYVYLTTSSYVTKDIHDRATNITLKNAAGTQVSQSLIAYDDTGTLTSITGITHHDDANFGTGNTLRGNATTSQVWVTGSTYLTSNHTYDTTGQVLTTKNPKLNTTTFSYTDAFYKDNNASPPLAFTPAAPTNAYLTKTTLPNGNSTAVRYYYHTGKFAWDKDENVHSSYAHYIDPLDRLTVTSTRQFSSGNPGWTLYKYTSTTQTDMYTGIATATPATTCGACRHDIRTVDTLGRVIRITLASDPDGQTFTDFTYDTSSRSQTVTNPYRTTADPTYGLESYQYDGLARTTADTHADSNVAYRYFGAGVATGGGASAQLCASGTYGVGYPLLSVDEAGKKSQTWQDGFGRTIEADEPDASNALTVATCYKFDALNNTTQTVQSTQTRTFAFDGLARLISSTEPESGTTSLYYTTSAGALCSGTASDVCRKTDARSKTITYAYDTLDRLTSKTYSDSTPTVSYFYDQTSYNGLTIVDGLGRRTGMSDGSGQTAWTYNDFGLVLTKRKTIGTITQNITYTYNNDGSLDSVEYPYTTSNTTISYTYSNAQRELTASDIGRSITYAKSATYAPQGQLASVIYGKATGFAGITRTRAYNNRLQPTTLADSSPNGTVQSYAYSFDLGGGLNNGNVGAITDNVTTGRSQTISYDNLNRVSSAQTSATSGTTCWGYSFGYDRYANLLSSTPTKCSAPPLSVSVDAGNHVTNSGVTYDAAGNMTNDGSQAYTWDAENRLISAGTATYLYDGDGMRVQKVGSENHWFDEHGQLLAETNQNGNNLRQFTYFEGRIIARREYNTGNIYFYFTDHSNSTRNMTDATGHLQYSSDFYPFGGENNVFDCAQNSTCSASDATGTNHTHKFTEKMRDPESGNALDYSQYRMLHVAFGRWQSTDPVSGSLNSPQTLNRYAYVSNNPTNLVDPLGLYFIALADDLYTIKVNVWAPAPCYYTPWRPISPILYDRPTGGGGGARRPPTSAIPPPPPSDGFKKCCEAAKRKENAALKNALFETIAGGGGILFTIGAAGYAAAAETAFVEADTAERTLTALHAWHSRVAILGNGLGPFVPLYLKGVHDRGRAMIDYDNDVELCRSQWGTKARCE